MALPTTATVRVYNVPFTAVAEELSSFFDSAAGPVFACKIATHRLTWKSKGHARVQFDSLHSACLSLQLSVDGLLPLFQGARLSLSPSHNDIVPRPADPRNRLRATMLHAGYLVEETWLQVLQSWGDVAVEIMPEREQVSFVVNVEGGERYRLDIMFRDVVGTFGCTIVGIESNALLFKLKHSPRIYQRISPTKLSSTNSVNRYHFFKEDIPCQWVRTTDFSASCSIGQSDHFCVELQHDCCFATDVIALLPFYSSLDDLTITQGEPLGSSSGVVPVINHPSECPLSYEVLFLLNSLVHAQKIGYGQVNKDLFSALCVLSVETAKRVLLELLKVKSTCFEPVKFIRDQLDKMRKNPKDHIMSDRNMPARNLMYCYRVLITPARVYFLGPEIEISNHVVKHHDASDFIRVSFVDEDWSKVPPDALSTQLENNLFAEPYQTKIYQRILSILSKGISIGSKHFEFLAFSASQLRSNSVWMFASNENVTAEGIRGWMGNFSKIRSVSKCAARMGQLFSSSVQTLDVHPNDVNNIDDIEITTDGIKYCFSDGIGKISATFAAQVAEKCGLDKVPSAFQIRYGGYKGVLAIDHSSIFHLSLRPSMLKFDSCNTMLNVTKWSASMPCYLNREIICLLSTLGVDDAHFEALQQDQLQLLHEVFTNTESALKFLDGMSGAENKTALKMLMIGYKPDKEPYLLMLLKTYCQCHLSDIKSKCRIYVPKGRVLLGCLDEAEILSYGEVYIKVTLTDMELKCLNKKYFEIAEDKKTATVVGPVIVTKNPCLHPGDIRVLHAVNNCQLEKEGLLDCVVFPQKGQRPHPNECSGGDLDGDLYFVCWDENLIPPVTEVPMDYIGRRLRILDHDVKLQEIYEFFVDYMINDALGTISTAHLVHADREPDKARSQKCLQLASLHSMAVDFAKTGAPANMPKVLRSKEYPDFMERINRTTYISNGILGKLYRTTIKWIEEMNSSCRWTDSIEVEYDYDLEVKGFETFLDDANVYKKHYAERLSALMNYYGAVTEDEILTGNLRSRSTYLERDKKKYTELKDRILVAIKALHREVATEWFKGGCSEDDFPKLVSACYHVTYHPDHRSGTSFLSFPWIFCDILLSIKSLKAISR